MARVALTPEEKKYQKLLKALPVGWVEEADAMDEQQLRNVIVQSEHNIQTSKVELQNSEEYQRLKGELDLIAGPYKDAIKAQKAKIEYALLALSNKGKL